MKGLGPLSVLGRRNLKPELRSSLGLRWLRSSHTEPCTKEFEVKVVCTRLRLEPGHSCYAETPCGWTMRAPVDHTARATPKSADQLSIDGVGARTGLLYMIYRAEPLRKDNYTIKKCIEADWREGRAGSPDVGYFFYQHTSLRRGNYCEDFCFKFHVSYF